MAMIGKLEAGGLRLEAEAEEYPALSFELPASSSLIFLVAV
jgi:hypothetical protein